MAAERDEQAIAFRLQKRKNPKYLEPASQATAFSLHICHQPLAASKSHRGRLNRIQQSSQLHWLLCAGLRSTLQRG